MTTRLALRTAARQRLEDTSATPLWNDDTLNEFLRDAVGAYGVRFPREQVTTVAVTTGATRITITPAIEAEQVRAIFDADGVRVPRQQAFDPDDSPFTTTVTGQAWRWWNSTLILNHPTPSDGNWTIEHQTGRALPGDDTTDADILPGDEEIVIQLAIAAALRRRAIEDGKRGLGHAGTAVESSAMQAEARAEQLLTARRRRVRGGWMTMP